MFSRQHSPLKRKHNEYHDPDYPQQELQPAEEEEDDDDGTPGCSTHFANKRRKPVEEFKTEKEARDENYFNKVRQVIEREFQKEIVMKQEQLEEIDERLEKAKQLLDRLRYGIVSAYYKKQEIPLTAADATTLRGPNCLFEREDKGPQMPLHPSIKKLIGKKPKDLSEVIRSCPKRTAAQNAVQTIRAKSQLQKREERKLKQIIREQGIVIDHSKQNSTENDVNSLLNVAAQNNLNSNQDLTTTSVKPEKKGKNIANKPSGKSLNAARLNNKIKHLIVVGNTSKYIGNEVERDIKSPAQNLTHKWLVYVQSKDSTKQPIERFVKKIRFHLHHSYRPNDVVDIEAPPFQVSRRGWGEFPIRVQLFFHPEFHQKPVQLVHNIILDQTLSGIQTLGAETLLEIWLREVKPASSSLSKEVKKEPEIMKKPEIPTKLKTSFMSRSEELMDDNLLDFLNKIEASPCSISADIEKIQPTVVVTEPFGVKPKTPSPEKYKAFSTAQPKSPIKMPPLMEIAKIPEKSIANTTTITNSNIIEAPKIPSKSLANTHIEAAKISEKSLAITTTTTSNTIAQSAIIEEKSLALIPATTSNTTTVSAAPLTIVASSAGEFKTPIFTNGSLTTKPMTTFVRLPNSSSQVRFINTTSTHANNIPPPLRPLTPTPPTATIPPHSLHSTITTQKSSLVLNKDGKILMPSASVASAVRRTILPIVNSSTSTNIPSKASQFINTNKPTSSSLPSAAPKQILQKKLVQLVDSTGKVKYIQMLVAASSASSSIHNLSTSSVAPKLISMAPSLVKNNTVTNTTQITNTVTTPLLRSTNGAQLMPAMTMKPNIFKIVPESMQTKPQILTFSTTAVVATNTHTMTTAHNQQSLQQQHHQQLQHTITTNTRTMGQITTPSTMTTLKSNNNNNGLALPVANKLQKPNGSNHPSVNATKNLVFQKEGKLYIIDPQQMKYKQQQKKQVSLLKPQISLLKQQQQQKLNNTLPTPPAAAVNSLVDTKPATTPTQLSNNNTNVPQVHFGLKQQRINTINALQLIQMKRVLFEKQFLRQEFTNVRSAVEFLLRRLKLVVSKDSLVAVFPFVCHSLQEFHSLTAFKQRACEWLRAKNISRLLRNHKDLQRLNNSSKETFWSTKEIAIFARQYAYTPPIKSLPKPGEQQEGEGNNKKDFMDLVKSELKQEHNLQYDTLTDHHKVRKWVDKVWHTLEDYEYNEDQHQIIDIDGIIEEEPKTNRKNSALAHSSTKHLTNASSSNTYLSPPPHLEHECQLVSDICKDLNIKLNPEELDTKLYHPSTQTVLAQCLHLFIEKLLRQSIALKQEKTLTPSALNTVCTLMPQDLAKVLATNSEFDFLTNNNFGSASLAECLVESAIKQEKS